MQADVFLKLVALGGSYGVRYPVRNGYGRYGHGGRCISSSLAIFARMMYFAVVIHIRTIPGPAVAAAVVPIAGETCMFDICGCRHHLPTAGGAGGFTAGWGNQTTYRRQRPREPTSRRRRESSLKRATGGGCARGQEGNKKTRLKSNGMLVDVGALNWELRCLAGGAGGPLGGRCRQHTTIAACHWLIHRGTQGLTVNKAGRCVKCFNMQCDATSSI